MTAWENQALMKMLSVQHTVEKHQRLSLCLYDTYIKYLHFTHIAVFLIVLKNFIHNFLINSYLFMNYYIMTFFNSFCMWYLCEVGIIVSHNSPLLPVVRTQVSGMNVTDAIASFPSKQRGNCI